MFIFMIVARPPPPRSTGDELKNSTATVNFGPTDVFSLTIYNRTVIDCGMPAVPNAVFKTLADPTRRSICERLCRDGEPHLWMLTDRSGVSTTRGFQRHWAFERRRLGT